MVETTVEEIKKIKLLQVSTKQKDFQPCPFSQFGCSYEDGKQKVRKHIKETPTRHLSYLCDGIHDLIAEVRATQLVMESDDRQHEALCYRIKELDIKFSVHQVWRIDNIKFLMDEAKIGKRPIIFSPPFFTGKQGYKLAASAALFGDGNAKGQYVSVFLSVLRSDWDALLNWPFSCTTTFSILDQQADSSARHNITETFKPNTCKENRPFVGRPIGERNPSFGIQKFANFKSLEMGEFIKDDAMFIKIDLDTSDVTKV